MPAVANCTTGLDLTDTSGFSLGPMQFAPDLENVPESPELRAIRERMEARFLATGQVNPPVGSPEQHAILAGGERAAFWTGFWRSVGLLRGRR